MSDGYKGTQRPNSGAGQFNAMSYLIRSILGRTATTTLVEVKAVEGEGLAPVGFVDVQPMVHQVDGDGGIMPHGIIHHIPYFRLQGGANAVIIDPQPGDIGICLFAHTDLSGVKANRKPSAPGSMRRFDMADGLYIGGVLNGAPAQYIIFSGDGMKAVSPTKIICQAPDVEMDASDSFTVNSPNIVLNGQLTQGKGSNGGTATLAGPVTVNADLTANGKSVSGHTHKENGTGNQTSTPT